MGKVNLNAMKSKLDNMSQASNYSNTEYDKLVSGKNVRRVLFPKGNSESFYSEGFVHFSLGAEGNKVVTSNLTDVNGKAQIALSFPVTVVGTKMTYTLKEDVHATPISGMTYSDQEYQLVIEFVDNLDGTVGTVINGTKTDTAEFSFTNVYEPIDASLILSGSKVLNGRILNESEFSFSIYETDSTYGINGVEPFETVWANHDGSFE